jgi:methyltransferase-like protein
MLANLRNETVELQDDFGLAVLGLLDGTRDRGQIVDVLARAVLDGGSTMEADGRPVTDPAEVRALLTERLEDALAELAGSALLMV